MNPAKFQNVHPVLPVTNIAAAIRFYTDHLGFRTLFQDPADIDLEDPTPRHPSYAVIERDNVRLHLQSHNTDNPEDRTEPLHLRFLIDDVDSLYTEYQSRGAINLERFTGKVLADTPWGTREFGLYDPDRNGLFFYRSL